MFNNLFSNFQMGLILLVVLVLIVVYVISLQKKYKEQGKEAMLQDLRETAYILFQKAEEKYGAKAGPDKMAWAITQFYKNIMPDDYEKYLPGTTVEKFLQDTFDNGYTKLKDFLDDGMVNGISSKVINSGGTITNTEKL